MTTGLGYNSARTLYNQTPFFKDFLPLLAYKYNPLKLQRISLCLIFIDGTVRGENMNFFVIPAEAGIQQFQSIVDAGSSPA